MIDHMMQRLELEFSKAHNTPHAASAPFGELDLELELHAFVDYRDYRYLLYLTTCAHEQKAHGLQ